jgi:hypothetical protein
VGLHALGALSARKTEDSSCPPHDVGSKVLFGHMADDAPSDQRISDGVERPVFIVGAERSGSTMFWLMLDSHPDVAIAGEMEYIVGDHTELGWPSIEEFEERVRHDLMFQTSGFVVDTSLDYQGLVRSFMAQRLAIGSETIACAVVHLDFSQLIRLWPEARFIHLVRDGRDVSYSVVEMGWAGIAYAGADHWLTALAEWDRLEPLVGSSRLYEITYEELVADPRAVLDGVCKFIGVEFDESMFSYVETTEYAFPNAGYSHRWRVREQDRGAEVLEHKLAGRLEEYGYECVFEDASGPSSIEKMRFRVSDKWGRIKRRIDRAGPALVLTDVVTRLPVISRLPGMLRLRRWVEDSMLEVSKADRKRHWDPDGSELLR